MSGPVTRNKMTSPFSPLAMQSSELGPSLHPQEGVSPPPLVLGRGNTLLAGEGMGGPNTDEGTDSVYGTQVYMYFVVTRNKMTRTVTRNRTYPGGGEK